MEERFDVFSVWNSFVYDKSISDDIAEEGKKIIDDFLKLNGGNLYGEILLETKYERRKRIVDKLLAESLEN